MNVLSLFDGISCGRVALERAGIKVGKYYASEIDKYAIQISKKNWPEIIQLGDINNWREWDIDFSKIDLLMAGFPCQAWSVAGKQGGDTDPRGQLVHVLIEIWNKCRESNPNLKFLFENVKMKKEFIEYINNLFGVEPILINSALVSAQNRKRLYWTNIPNITQPEDRGILLKDIVHENVDCNVSAVNSNGKAHSLTASYNGAVAWNSYERHQRTMLFEELKQYIVSFDKTLKILEKEVEKGKVGYFRKDSQANRVYFIHDKAVTLCGEAGGGSAKMGMYLFGSTKRNSQGDRVYSEDEKSPTLNASSGGTAGKGNLLFGCITPDRINKRQNGQRFSKGKKFYTLTAQDKHGILIEGYIRKLTPVECERLQTIDDGYTEGISNSQRYKALGNGWTVEVISHIIKGINN